MITCTYTELLALAADCAGLDADDLVAGDVKRLRRYLSEALDDIWVAAWWPDLMRNERRICWPEWSASSTYAAGTFVWHILSSAFYVSLRAVPAGQEPTDSDGVVNDAYWAAAASSYSADEWSSTAAYVVGDRAFYQATGKWYQAHTASTGQTPDTAAYWGELVALTLVLPYEQSGQTAIGDVCRIGVADWRLKPLQSEAKFYLDSDGVCVPFLVGPFWIEFRIRPPQLTGDEWDSTAAYAVGDQAHFITDGHLYDCIAVTTAGQSPLTHPAKWSVVQLPEFMKHAAALSAAADYLSTRNKEDSARLDMQADRMLDKELDRLLRQQGQMRRTNWRN